MLLVSRSLRGPTPSGDRRLKIGSWCCTRGSIAVKATAETGKTGLQLISWYVIAHMFAEILTGGFCSNECNFQQIDWQIGF
ncbi:MULTISPECIES: hypothetical protein [unclassified Microcoleus]|uniref:hypothetical protein n=1 Tax=unclassified Microcoleus TaxID=2642155 RepID=UPI002FD1338A